MLYEAALHIHDMCATSTDNSCLVLIKLIENTGEKSTQRNWQENAGQRTEGMLQGRSGGWGGCNSKLKTLPGFTAPQLQAPP